jgi:hypothetical protein
MPGLFASLLLGVGSIGKSMTSRIHFGTFFLLLPLFGASHAVSGVGNNPDPVPSVGRADGASWQKQKDWRAIGKPGNIVSDLLKVINDYSDNSSLDAFNNCIDLIILIFEK